MMIAGQRVSDTFALHDHERDAIGERPLFVKTLFVQINSFREQPAFTLNHNHVRIVVKFLKSFLELTAAFEGVCELRRFYVTLVGIVQ